MSSHEISFNTNLSDPIKTRADFIYKISPSLISITDIGLGSLPVTDFTGMAKTCFYLL